MIRYEETLLVPYAPHPVGAERLLILAPHPDDEVLGCGGFASLTVRAGGAAMAVIATDGGAGNFSGKEEAQAYIALREQESRSAAQIAGLLEPKFFRFADRSLREQATALGIRLIETIREYKPSILLAPSPAEIHPDHIAAAHAAFDSLIEVRRGETVSPFELWFYEVSAALAPNRLIAIDDAIEAKRDALRVFASQLRERPFDELILGLNRWRAMTLPPPIRFAEAFHAVEASSTDWAAICLSIGPQRGT